MDSEAEWGILQEWHFLVGCWGLLKVVNVVVALVELDGLKELFQT